MFKTSHTTVWFLKTSSNGKWLTITWTSPMHARYQSYFFTSRPYIPFGLALNNSKRLCLIGCYTCCVYVHISWRCKRIKPIPKSLLPLMIYFPSISTIIFKIQQKYWVQCLSPLVNCHVLKEDPPESRPVLTGYELYVTARPHFQICHYMMCSL